MVRLFPPAESPVSVPAASDQLLRGRQGGEEVLQLHREGDRPRGAHVFRLRQRQTRRRDHVNHRPGVRPRLQEVPGDVDARGRAPQATHDPPAAVADSPAGK